jgi:hypothetical protein
VRQNKIVESRVACLRFSPGGRQPIAPSTTAAKSKGWKSLLHWSGMRRCSALSLKAENDIGSLTVMDSEALNGIITERHYARNIALKGKSSSTTAMGEIMDRRVITVRPEQSVEECMALMTERRARHLPVVEGEKNKSSLATHPRA